jgi:anti-anti-sigma factor
MDNVTSIVRGIRGRQAAFVHDSLEGVESLHVIGDIDLANAAEFEAAIMRMSQFKGPIVINLMCCTYMDSSTIHALLETSKRLKFGVVAATNSIAQRVFTIMDASASLSIEYKLFQTIEWNRFGLGPCLPSLKASR